MNLFRTTLLLAAGLVTGCASVPDALEGNYSESFYPNQATEQSVNANVRWGGSVIKTMPEADRTCIEVLAKPLDRQAEPTHSDEDLGRFLACRNEFMDPEIFENGREVTAVGRISGFRDGSVGDYNYVYPVVDADAVELWPEEVETAYYSGGYYGYGYSYWPYYRSPFYYRGFGSRYYYPYSSRGFIHGSGSVQSASGSGSANTQK